MINVTFHVGDSCSIDETLIYSDSSQEPSINSLQPRTYGSDKIFTNVKWLFDCIRFVSLEDCRIRFFWLERYFSTSTFYKPSTEDDIEFPWRCSGTDEPVNNVKSYALPKRNSTKVLFLTSLRISSLVSIKLQEYDSPNRGPPFIKCAKLYKAAERCSSKFAQNLSGDFVNYT